MFTEAQLIQALICIQDDTILYRAFAYTRITSTFDLERFMNKHGWYWNGSVWQYTQGE